MSWHKDIYKHAKNGKTILFWALRFQKMGYMQIKHQNLHSYIIEKVKKKKFTN